MTKQVTNEDLIRSLSEALSKDPTGLGNCHGEFALLKVLMYVQENSLFLQDNVDWFKFQAGSKLEAGITKGFDSILWSLLQSVERFWDVLNKET